MPRRWQEGKKGLWDHVLALPASAHRKAKVHASSTPTSWAPVSHMAKPDDGVVGRIGALRLSLGLVCGGKGIIRLLRQNCSLSSLSHCLHTAVLTWWKVPSSLILKYHGFIFKHILDIVSDCVGCNFKGHKLKEKSAEVLGSYPPGISIHTEGPSCFPWYFLLIYLLWCQISNGFFT